MKRRTWSDAYLDFALHVIITALGGALITGFLATPPVMVVAWLAGPQHVFTHLAMFLAGVVYVATCVAVWRETA